MSRPSPRSLLPLPDLSYHVLLALAGGASHGWATIKRIRSLSEGRSDPSSGSLYLAMLRLKDAELIEEARPPEAGADRRRKYYRLTDFGREVLRAETARLAALVDVARGFGMLAGKASPRPAET